MLRLHLRFARPCRLCPDCRKQLATRQSLALELLKKHNPILPEDSLYQAYMKILDFVGGMTDNSAAKMAQDLSG